MSKKTIETFFSGKNLVVPSYQRDYAWRERNINELFADVDESIEVGGHYLGTFILSQNSSNEPVYVVDGQQRLTTLTMMLDALIDVLEDREILSLYRSMYIRHPISGPKFKVLGENNAFFRSMLAKECPTPESAGQIRLADAYQHIRLRVQAMLEKGGQDLIKQWLDTLTKMEVLEFIEPNEGKAIRMFQSVNDRGVPLSKMDIVKSLLVYYSNRYLAGELDISISEQFGKAFRTFSNIKALASESGYLVRQVNRDTFREDDVLRYHYFAFNGKPYGVESGGDYNATTKSVLETFLKPSLQMLRSKPEQLKAFIEAYTSDLAAFFEGLETLLKDTRTNRTNYMLFVVQDLAATLYPLVIRLHLLGWLPNVCVPTDSRTLLELIELVDLRVFKLRGTNPQADVFSITRSLPSTTQQQVVKHLQNFCQKFMPDALMGSRLVDEDLYRNMGLHRMLWEEEDQVRAALGHSPVNVADMAGFNHDGLTMEHILPQKPSFNVLAYGFESEEQYEQYKHRMGNLVLLEGGINSACNNSTVEEKVTAPNLYLSSNLKAVKGLAAQRAGAIHGFRREDVDVRGNRLCQFALKRWPIVCN